MLIRNAFRTPVDFFLRLAPPETPLSALPPGGRQGNDGRHLDIRRRIPERAELLCVQEHDRATRTAVEGRIFCLHGYVAHLAARGGAGFIGRESGRRRVIVTLGVSPSTNSGRIVRVKRVCRLRNVAASCENLLLPKGALTSRLSADLFCHAGTPIWGRPMSVALSDDCMQTLRQQALRSWVSNDHRVSLGG